MRTRRTLPIDLAAERAAIGLLGIESVLEDARARSPALAEAWRWETLATASARVACEIVERGGAISRDSASRLETLAERLATSTPELPGFDDDPLASAGVEHLTNVAARLREGT